MPEVAYENFHNNARSGLEIRHIKYQIKPDRRPSIEARIFPWSPVYATIKQQSKQVREIKRSIHVCELHY